MGLDSFLLQQFCPAPKKHIRRNIIQSLHDHLNDAFECEPAQEDEGYESGSESLNIPTLLCRAPCLYHVSTCDNLFFRPATPRAHSPHQPGNLTTVHCHLRFKDDDNSSINSATFHARTEHHSPVEHPLAHHLSSADDNKEETDKKEEHFPTGPLHDNIWMEEPVPGRHLCIHEDSQHKLCMYPCPYSLDQLHLNYAPQCMDLCKISNFQDVTTTTSDEDIPILEDVFQL